MSNETKLETPQLVDAWVRMYCAALPVRGVSELSGGAYTELAAEDADFGIAELRKRLPVEGGALGDADMRHRVETVLEKWTLAFVGIFKETVSDMAEEVRAAMRGGADADTYVYQPGLPGSREESRLAKRTAEEWREACEKVAGDLWRGDGVVRTYESYGMGWCGMAGTRTRPGLVEVAGCDTESDALEQLHAALCKRLEQKRRREGGEHG